jgi:hypothetical protein
MDQVAAFSTCHEIVDGDHTAGGIDGDDARRHGRHLGLTAASPSAWIYRFVFDSAMWSCRSADLPTAQRGDGLSCPAANHRTDDRDMRRAQSAGAASP